MIASRRFSASALLPVSLVLCALLFALTMTTTVNALSSPGGGQKKKFYGGAGVGRLVFDGAAAKEGVQQCHYDMVLCERLGGGDKTTDSGLYVPGEDLPRLHMCKVLSMGAGREEENGRIAPMPEIVVGDIVIAKNPWGIGPKDEETVDGKKLSYMRSQDIAAVVSGGIVDDE